MRYVNLSFILAVLFVASVLVACGQKASQDDANGLPAENAGDDAGPSDAEIQQVENDLNEIAALDEFDDSELDGLDEDLAQI